MPEYQMQPYYDFLGGLNVDAAPDHVADNELTLAENVDLSERGGLIKRKGASRLNETSYEGNVSQIIEWQRNDGSDRLLAVIDEELFEVNRTTGAITSVQSLDNNHIAYYSTQDVLYFIDGTEYYQYDGTSASVVSGSDSPEVKRCKYGVRHPRSLRFFVAGDPQNNTALYFSDINAPHTFRTPDSSVPGTNVLFPNTGEGPITGLAVFGDAVLVFFQYSIWAYRGIDPESDATWQRLAGNIGTLSNDTISHTTSSLTFLGDGGIYSITPGAISQTLTVQPGENTLTNWANGKIESLVNKMGSKSTAKGVFDLQNQRYMVAYSPTGSASNTRILVLDWLTKSFTIYTDLSINDFLYSRDGNLYAATNGYVLKMNQSYSDPGGEDIKVFVKTKEYSLGVPFHRKKFVRLFLSYKQTPEDPITLNVHPYVDTVELPTIEENTTYQGFTWGASVWGEDNWGARTQITARQKVYSVGNRIQLWIKEESNRPMVFYGLAFEYTPVRTYGGVL